MGGFWLGACTILDCVIKSPDQRVYADVPRTFKEVEERLKF